MPDPNAAAALALDGAAAPPRRNGELAFDAPWESRLFGLTMTLVRAGRFDWSEFQRELVREIGLWDAQPDADSYWRCWERAFETLLASKGLCGAADVERRARALVERSSHHR